MYTRFQTKTAQKPYPMGRHIPQDKTRQDKSTMLYLFGVLYKGVPPGGGGGVDNSIHWINNFPVEKGILSFLNTYPADGNLSGG